MNKAIFEAFRAGFNAGRALPSDSLDAKAHFERAWKLFVQAQSRRSERQYAKANEKARLAHDPLPRSRR